MGIEGTEIHKYCYVTLGTFHMARNWTTCWSIHRTLHLWVRSPSVGVRGKPKKKKKKKSPRGRLARAASHSRLRTAGIDLYTFVNRVSYSHLPRNIVLVEVRCPLPVPVNSAATPHHGATEWAIHSATHDASCQRDRTPRAPRHRFPAS